MLFLSKQRGVTTPSQFVRSLVVLAFIAGGCKATATLTDYGIEKKDQYFSIAVLPDTQYYTAERNGGNMQMFKNQINWIIKNKEKEKISYVIHLGDVTDRNTEKEWGNARGQMYRLDAAGIPFGLAVGNHDQTPNSNPAAGDPNTGYSKSFGKHFFSGKSWYGGGMGSTNNNDNHFDFINVKGQQFLILYLVYNQPGHERYNAAYEKLTMTWADSVLGAHPDRKAIIVSHGTVGKPAKSNSNFVPGEGQQNLPGKFTRQGQVIYDIVKHHKNAFIMLGGHIAGESFRRDTFDNRVIKTFLSDYQSRRDAPYDDVKYRNGGNGTMRLMRFNLTKQTVSVVTLTPRSGGAVELETDADSQFTEPLYN